jgi:hypothetical protein
MSRPPSQAVIEAVEQAEREHRWFEWCGNHPDGEFCCECGTHDTSPHHRRFEVARAAEAAALRAAAERMDDLSRGAPLAAAITARAAAIRLDHWADELTDEAREDVP